MDSAMSSKQEKGGENLQSESSTSRQLLNLTLMIWLRVRLLMFSSFLSACHSQERQTEICKYDKFLFIQLQFPVYIHKPVIYQYLQLRSSRLLHQLQSFSKRPRIGSRRCIHLSPISWHSQDSPAGALASRVNKHQLLPIFSPIAIHPTYKIMLPFPLLLLQHHSRS